MRLKYILNIAQADLQVYLADRNNLVGLFVMPLIFTLVIGFAFGGNVSSSNNLVIDVIDLDQSELSAQFVDDLRAVNDTLLICPMDDGNGVDCGLETDENDNTIPLTIEETRERVAEEQVSAGIAIPAGYAEGIRNFEGVTIDYYSLADVTTGDAVLQSVQVVIERIDGGIVAAQIGQAAGEVIGLYDDGLSPEAFSEAVYNNATAQWQNPPVAVAYRLTTGDNTNAVPGGFEQSVPGMATMFVMFTVLGGMQVMLRERKTWTLQRLIMMPISRAEILGGKIVSRFVLGVIQFMIVFAVGVFVGMNFGTNILAILIIIAAYTLTITALSFALAPLFKDEFQAGTAVTMIALPLAALGGAWWPLEIVPDFMQVIGRISPVSWAMDGFNQMIFYNGGWGDILVPIAVLLVISAGLFVIGIVNFRYE